LSPAEFVDAADGALSAGRAAHLDACGPCRARAAEIAATLAAARDVEGPEPSPLYWTHLSARIREGVANETIAPAWRAGAWWRPGGVRRLVPVASAVALVGAVVVSGLMMRGDREVVPIEPAPIRPTVSLDSGVQPEDSEAWQMLTSAAAETPIEEAHAAGMGVPAGAVDRAVQRMTPEELTALGRLLQSELRRSGD